MQNHFFKLLSEIKAKNKKEIIKFANNNDIIIKKLFVKKIFKIDNQVGGGPEDLKKSREELQNISEKMKDFIPKLKPIIDLLEYLKNIKDETELNDKIQHIIDQLKEMDRLLTT